MINDSEKIAWFAGLMEGEGSFFISKTGDIVLSIGLNPKDSDTIEQIVSWIKIGRINGPYKNKTDGVIFWKCTKLSEIYWILPKIYPYLSKRRKQQAQVLLDALVLKPSIIKKEI